MFRDLILCEHLSWIPNLPMFSTGNVTSTHTFCIILRPRLCSLCCCLPTCWLSLLSWRSLTWLLSSDFPHLTISSLDDSGFERQSLHTEFTLMHHMMIPRCTIGYPIQLNCAPVEFLYFQCITFFVWSSFQTVKLFDNKEVKSFGSFLDLRSELYY